MTENLFLPPASIFISADRILDKSNQTGSFPSMT